MEITKELIIEMFEGCYKNGTTLYMNKYNVNQDGAATLTANGSLTVGNVKIEVSKRVAIEAWFDIVSSKLDQKDPAVVIEKFFVAKKEIARQNAEEEAKWNAVYEDDSNEESNDSDYSCNGCEDEGPDTCDCCENN